jgi:hypothetical protein
VARASVSGSAFTLALSDPKALDRRLGSLYATEDWVDGPDGVAMSTLQRNAFLKELALVAAPHQARPGAASTLDLHATAFVDGVFPRPPLL